VPWARSGVEEGFKKKINNEYLELGDPEKERRLTSGIINNCFDKKEY